MSALAPSIQMAACSGTLPFSFPLPPKLTFLSKGWYWKAFSLRLHWARQWSLRFCSCMGPRCSSWQRVSSHSWQPYGISSAVWVGSASSALNWSRRTSHHYTLTLQGRTSSATPIDTSTCWDPRAVQHPPTLLYRRATMWEWPQRKWAVPARDDHNNRKLND